MKYDFHYTKQLRIKEKQTGFYKEVDQHPLFDEDR